MKPYGYQEKAMKQLQDANYTGLLAACLGGGKTPMAVWLMERLKPQATLIVGPVRTAASWERTVKQILGQELKVISSKVAGKKHQESAEAGEPGVYFIGWELMRTRYSEKRYDGRAQKSVSKSVPNPFNGTEFDLVVADEWHRAANHSSLNFAVISRVKAKHRLALSATPAGNKAPNIWAAYKWLWPSQYPGYWEFCRRHFVEEYNPFSAFGKSYSTEKRPGLVRQLAPCHLEVPLEVAHPEMPDVLIERVSVGLTREQRKTYKQWEENALAWLNSHPVAIDLPAHLDMRLRQVTLGEPTLNSEGVVDYAVDCKSSKLDAMMDLIADLPESEPIVVWVHSQKFIKAVLHRLNKAGITAAEISGKSKADYHDMINGKVRVLVAQHEAMSEGVDGLQRVCHVEIWLSLSNSPVINQQATGRLHRDGQKSTVMRYLIQAENTVDERVLGRLEEKHNILKESGLI